MEGHGCCPAGGKKEETGEKEGACHTMKKSCGPGGGGKCCAKLFCGAIAGAIVMFAVMSASWMLLPFHGKTMHGFKDEKAVARVLLDNAPAHGVYVLPHVEDMAQAPEVTAPFAFVSVLPEGFDCIGKMPVQMGLQFLLCFVGAWLLTGLLKKGQGCPVRMSFKVGLLVALLHNAPNFLWWHFPLDFTLIGAADDLIGITLAGIVISKCVLKCGKEKCAPAGACPGCGCTDCKCKKDGGGCGSAEAKGTCGA